MTEQLDKATEHLNKFNEYLAVVGDPASVVDVVSGETGTEMDLSSLGNFTESAKGTYQAGQTLMSNAQSLPQGVDLSSSVFQQDRIVAGLFNELQKQRKKDAQVQKETHAEDQRLKRKLQSATTQAEVDKISVAVALNNARAQQSSETISKIEREYQAAATQYDAEEKLTEKASNELMLKSISDWQEQTNREMPFELKIKKRPPLNSNNSQTY